MREIGGGEDREGSAVDSVVVLCTSIVLVLASFVGAAREKVVCEVSSGVDVIGVDAKSMSRAQEHNFGAEPTRSEKYSSYCSICCFPRRLM